jgi:hypothetical protein
MYRAALILVALAAFTVACASGAEVSATTHRRTPARTHVYSVHRRTIARKVYRRVEARTQRRGAEKQTPEEVGRAAGLAMLRGIEQNRTTRRNDVYRRRGARPELRSVSIRTSHHQYRADTDRADTGQPVEAELASPSPASDTRRTDQEETAASRAAEWRRDAESRSAANEAVNERGAAKPTETNEYADRGQGFADGQAPRASDPEREGHASMTEHPAAAQSTASYAAEPEEDGTDGNSATETEQASLYIPRGAMPLPLYGTLASLERIENESDLEARIADGLLVPVPASGALIVNAELPADHRYCRPWTAKFLADLAQEHDAAFHRPLEVSSAVRTVEYQRRLMEINGNAAPAVGDLVSPHLTGATVDIAKNGMSRSEIEWMRRRLLALEDAGRIDAEEEFHQACFHITVYKTYAPARTMRSPLKATSPNRPKQHQPAPSAANVEAATGL